MTEDQATQHHSVRQGVAAGTSVGAGMLLFTSGLLTLLQGISALAKDNLLVVGPQYVYHLNTTAWGWIQLVLGVLVMAVAVGLIMGATWARLAAIVIASVTIVTMFLWLPYYPMWAFVVIALSIVVIWAVTAWNPSS